MSKLVIKLNIDLLSQVAVGVVLLLASHCALALGVTTRISVDSAGGQGDRDSRVHGLLGGTQVSRNISEDGRFVTFSSEARNLVTDDTNDDVDVFVHDRDTRETTRVSVDSAGNQGNRASGFFFPPAISVDGRYVAFDSRATNLVAGDTNGDADVFVHDRDTGETTLVSVDSAENLGDGPSGTPSISDDGRYVAFHSFATNLVSGDTNGDADVFVHDRITSVTIRASVDSAGNEGNNDSFGIISADGRFVAFESFATNLVSGDTNLDQDIFVHDRDTGETTRVSVNSLGNQDDGDSSTPSISGDGRYVAFGSRANLVAEDTGFNSDIFVHDRETGETTRVSVSSAGNQGNSSSYKPSISVTGRIVGFESFASNLIEGDANGERDVFIHDRFTTETTRVSVNSEGGEGNDYSRQAAVNADGRYVTFLSDATNLIDGDTNGYVDVFVRDRGVPYPNTDSFLNDLVVYMGRTGNDESSEELFAIERKTGKKIRLTDNSYADGKPSLAPDGKTIVYASKQDGDWDLYTMDLDSRAATNITNTDGSVDEGWPEMSPAGGRLLFKRTVNGVETLAVMNIDGSELTTLLNEQYDQATWSPSGRNIVVSGLGGVGGLTLLPFMADFGIVGAPQTLTQSAYDDYPVFTNDGQYILFASNRCGNGDTKLGVYRYNLVNPEVTEILCEANSDYRHFSLMKDGRLLFTKAVDENSPKRPVYVTRRSLDFQDVSAMQAEIQNAFELTGVGFNNHPAAAQLYNEVADLPERYNPNTTINTGATKAVIITHGWNSGVIGQRYKLIPLLGTPLIKSPQPLEELNGWIIDFNNQDGIADRVCDALGATIDYRTDATGSVDKYGYWDDYTTHCSNGEWEVIVVDWSNKARTYPRIAWDRASELGAKNLANYIIDKSYEHVHIMGHSAGSQLIQFATNELIALPSAERPYIHLTFFDPYHPFPDIESGRQLSPYGQFSDWADLYVDTRPLPLIGKRDTTKLFSHHAYNVEVNPWDALEESTDPIKKMVRRHGWPYELYREETFDINMSFLLGFHISEESGKIFPNPDRAINSVCKLNDNPLGVAPLACQSPLMLPDPSGGSSSVTLIDSVGVVLKQVNNSLNGTHDLVFLTTSATKRLADIASLGLTTGSPAWQEWAVEIPEHSNAMSFDYKYLSSAEGLLTVYVNGQEVSQFDERYSGTGVQSSHLMAVGDLEPGEHRLAFRLDPFSGTASQVEITNVQFKRSESVPVIDIDTDGIPNDQDNDDDGDNVNDDVDLFPSDPLEWADNDSDGVGDNIDNDDDNDGFADGIDAFPFDPAEGDADGDAIDDWEDNCKEAANANQRDTDGDGYGNVCDADLNNDGGVNNLDFGLFLTVYLTAASNTATLSDHADFNGDAGVNNLDFGIFLNSYLSTPGPSCCGTPLP